MKQKQIDKINMQLIELMSDFHSYKLIKLKKNNNCSECSKILDEEKIKIVNENDTIGGVYVINAFRLE